MKKIKLFISIFLFVNISLLFAFDWPQSGVTGSEQIYSYFGQYRGDTISNSLIFSDPSEVKTASQGRILITISEHSDLCDFFPSTLGNAVLISHEDNLVTVYGNLDKTTIPENLFEKKFVEKAEVIGFTGNSAWQQGHSSLEFQVIDTKNDTSINPRVLLPRVGKELPLYYNELFIRNKNGNSYNLSKVNTVPAGHYRVYKKRQAIAVPYKEKISLNGSVIDQITFDVLFQDDNLICVAGKTKYTKNVLYPDDNLILMGELFLSPGTNALQLNLIDILGKETPATYILSVY